MSELYDLAMSGVDGAVEVMTDRLIEGGATEGEARSLVIRLRHRYITGRASPPTIAEVRDMACRALSQQDHVPMYHEYWLMIGRAEEWAWAAAGLLEGARMDEQADAWLDLVRQIDHYLMDNGQRWW